MIVPGITCDPDYYTEQDIPLVLDAMIEKIYTHNNWLCYEQLQVGGKCELRWNCSLTEWNNFCSEQMTFATTMESSSKPSWVASMIILGSVITADIYEHLSVMRKVPLFWKLLLLVQCNIAIGIATLNASIAAGQDNVVDILMNSTGLLILNDLDNLIGQLFIFGEEDGGEDFMAKIRTRDKSYALILSFPHLLFVFYYMLMFTGVFQFEHPMKGLQTIIYWNPYSIYFFPPIVVLAYGLFFFDCLECIRCKCCFGPDVSVVTEEEDKTSTTATGEKKEGEISKQQPLEPLVQNQNNQTIEMTVTHVDQD